MRKTVFTSLAACLLMFSACSPEDETTPNEENTPVSLQLGFARGGTAMPAAEEIRARSLVNGMGTGGNGKADRIGVYITGTDHQPYKGSEGRYTFVTKDTNGTSWECHEGTPPTGSTSTIYLSNLPATVQAFYPADAALTPDTDSGNHTVSVTIPATQTFNGGNAWECNATDYMYASGKENELIPITVSNQTPNTEGVISQTIYMYHALTKILFQIQNTEGQQENAYNYVKSITLTAATGTPFLTAIGTMQINNGTLSGLTSTNELIFTTTSPVTIGGTYTTVGYGLVAPITSTGSVKLTVKLGTQNDTSYDRTLTATLPATAWQTGCSYTYQLALKGHILIPTDIAIGTHTDESAGNEPVIDVD